MSLRVVVSIVGGASILAAGFLFGRHLASRLFVRLHVLEEIRAGLERLSTEVVYARSPLREAFLAVGRSAGSQCGAFFEAVAQGLLHGDGLPASDAWSKAVSRLVGTGDISHADAQAIDLLGPSLGASGSEDQQKHLQSAIARLSVQVEHARKEALKYDTFYREMGVLVAVAIVLLLL